MDLQKKKIPCKSKLEGSSDLKVSQLGGGADRQRDRLQGSQFQQQNLRVLEDAKDLPFPKLQPTPLRFFSNLRLFSWLQDQKLNR